jgi:hypothetical protein
MTSEQVLAPSASVPPGTGVGASSMGLTAWVSTAISGTATVVSLIALAVSIAANRSAGPRVSVLGSQLSGSGTDLWLQVKVCNSGRGEINLDGAWAGWLGATLTELPIRLRSGSSEVLVFRSSISPDTRIAGSLSIQIDLGNGETLMKRLALSETEIAYQSGRIAAYVERSREAGGRPAPESAHLQIEEI